MLLQWIKSLFTTGGQINPIAIVLLLGSSFYAYDELRDWRQKSRAANDCKVIQAQSFEKIERINSANEKENEAIKTINDDDLSDWSRLVNGMQRERN